jgi:hypothetical protein
MVAENGPVTTNILVKFRPTNPSGWAGGAAKASRLWSFASLRHYPFRRLDRPSFGPENDRHNKQKSGRHPGRFLPFYITSGSTCD